MPRPNQNIMNRYSGGERDFPHQDVYRAGGDRRVSFKHNPNRGGKFNVKKDWANAVRSHLEEEDIDMNIAGGSGKNFRKGKKNRRQGSPLPPDVRTLMFGPTGWYKIVIPHGQKYDKSFILQLLTDIVAPLQFWPVAWQSYGHAVYLYVDDRKVAEKLMSSTRQASLPDGFKLILKVSPGTPNVDMTDQLRDKMKLVMAKRYNADSKALNLTKFHADPELQDSFCALFKPIVFIAIIDIIEQNIPQLEALCLDDNNLVSFGFLRRLSKRLPSIKILHLAKNKVRNLTQLDAFVGLPIVELMLDGNPLCDKYRDQETYISEVRKQFPKCQKLDGYDLPPAISFDIAEEINLPEPQQTFLCNADGGVVVRQFLEQYFKIYDSKNRQPLLEAYHEHATFSFTTAYPYGLGKDKNVSWLNWYQTDNRNLLKLRDNERRCKLLKQGQLGVVSFLQEMPETKHDIHSFKVDLTVYNPWMICLTASGMFRELRSGHKVPPTRYFSKTLIIVPAGAGYCITNDVYHVTNATPDQIKEAFKTPSLPSPVSGTAAPPSTPEASPLIHAVVSPVVDNNTKQEMVIQLANKTGMNQEWTVKCLEGNDWDFMRACTKFDELHSKGTIPAEAFIK